mgnify:CR=1 FL=1
MEKNTRVGIIGYGFVGKATEYFLHWCKPETDISIHDPAKNYVIEDWNNIDYVFICVPTDLDQLSSKLDVSIIDSVIKDLKDKSYNGAIIIRSTIGPEQAMRFVNESGVIIMPEFLRENYWKEDVVDPMIPVLIGCYNCDDFVEWIGKGLGKELINCTPLEASAIKIYRNAALAVNVGLANDVKEICDMMDIDYRVIYQFFTKDKTLGNHWQVPGPDGKPGFGGTCLPKDLTHASSLCYNENNIMKTALEANKTRRDNE